MTLIKFNNRNRLFPWTSNGLKTFFNADELFNNSYFEEDDLVPAMNVKELDKSFEIEFSAPGFSKKDFEISIENDMLHISGKKEKESEELEKEYTRKEFSYNSFKRMLKLPDNVDVDQKVNATYKNGILNLSLQKKEENKKIAKKIVEVF